MTSFIAIDLETANESRSSICQIAAVVVQDNEIVETRDWLIRPKDLHFSPHNTFVHGITADDVKSAPDFPEVWNELKILVQGKTVIAHNVSFDMYALRDAISLYGLAMPEFNFWCTLVESKRRLSLTKYSLPSVCKHLNIEFQHHHHAKYDAIACAYVGMKLGNFSGYRRFPADMESVRGGYNPMMVKRADLAGIEIYDLSANVNPQMFFGKNVVVTGLFNEVSRAEAEEYVSRMGAKLSHCINGKTSLLIMGVDAGPSKIDKIKKLNKKSFVPIIDEKEFIEVLEALSLKEVRDN